MRQSIASMRITRVVEDLKEMDFGGPMVERNLTTGEAMLTVDLSLANHEQLEVQWEESRRSRLAGVFSIFVRSYGPDHGMTEEIWVADVTEHRYAAMIVDDLFKAASLG
jgi:hypothetical protein